MWKKIWLTVLAFCASCGLSAGQKVKPDEERDQKAQVGQLKLPRMPGSVFLFGSAPKGVWLSTPSGEMQLQPSSGEPIAWENPCIAPSITRDGSVVASVLWKENHKGDRPRRMAIATYSVAEKKWTEYAEGDFGDFLAISPNGAKLAYVGEGEERKECGYYQARVHVLDLRTFEETVSPKRPCARWTLEQLQAHSGLRSSASFSPQGSRLVLGHHAIEVWDLDTNAERKIADGTRPAWSPDGEWIAYFNHTREKRHMSVEIVHPDGTGMKTLLTIPFHQAFFGPPVWSPDSKTILLNWAREGDPLDIWLLDIETLKHKTLFKDVWGVGGWAVAK